MRVRLQGPLAEYELRHWSVRGALDEASPERFADEYAAASLLRRLIGDGQSFGLRSLVDHDGFDDRGLIDRLADALVRGTIVVIRTPHSIMATVPPLRIEPSYEPHAPEEIVEPESVWLGASADAEWLSLSVSAEPETLEFATSHQHLPG